MIDIGRSLPNLTVPAVTIGAAEMLALNGFSFFRRGPCRSAPSGSTPFSPRISGLRCRSLHRRKRGRDQQLVDDVADDLAVFFGLGACCDPLLITLERRPFLFSIRKRLPGEQIGQLLVGSADQRGEET